MSKTMMVWAVAAMLLIAAETLLPEIFLLWLGIAAGAMFFIVWAFPGTPPLWQAVAFVGLSLVSIGVYVKLIRGRHVAPERGIEQFDQHPVLLPVLLAPWRFVRPQERLNKVRQRRIRRPHRRQRRIRRRADDQLA
jgi:hypothetical protein